MSSWLVVNSFIRGHSSYMYPQIYYIKFFSSLFQQKLLTANTQFHNAYKYS
jgi:hypothetical protein